MISDVTRSYGRAWRLRNVFVGTHVLIRLAAYALISPLLGVLINLGVSLSSQSALTDQAIAGFILTPGGFVATMLVLGILLSAEVLGFAVMTALLRSDQANGWAALRAALALIGRRFRALVMFAVLFVLRVLAITVPFAAVGMWVFVRYLTDYDINYYLANRPPEFITALMIGVPLVAILALILLSQLTAWCLAVHFVLFGGVGPNAAFARSAEAMAGRRLKMQGDIVIWLIVRMLLVGALAVVASVVIDLVELGAGDALRLVLVVMGAVIGLWGLLGLVVSALALGALAVLLNDQFDRADPIDLADRVDATPRLSLHPGVLAAAVVGVIVIGLGAGLVLLDRISTPDSVEIIAHRGAAGLRPENTLASVEKGIEDGADWIEIDVQETADDRIVVVHDSDFMKLAGAPLKVWDATMPDLAEIDIGSWFDPEYSDQRTPLLRDVLEMAKGRAHVLIELKYYGHDVDLENRVIAIVEDLDMADQIAVMSLKYPAVQKVIGLRPDWRTGVLAATAVGDLARLDGDFVAVNQAMITPRLVRQTDAAEKDLYVWTINDPLTMSSMISRGVDGLITDEPALARQVLAFRAELSTPQRLFLWLAEVAGLDLSNREYRDASP